MNAQRKSTDDLLKRARSAMSLIGEPIQEDEIRGGTTGAEEVEEGLDTMATVLAEFEDIESAGGSLDYVLAELNEDEAIVSAAAELIELVGQVGYADGLSYEDTERAETLREKLYGALDALLNRLEGEQRDD